MGEAVSTAASPAAEAIRATITANPQPSMAAIERRKPKRTLRDRTWSMFGPGVPLNRKTAAKYRHQVSTDTAHSFGLALHNTLNNDDKLYSSSPFLKWGGVAAQSATEGSLFNRDRAYAMIPRAISSGSAMTSLAATLKISRPKLESH